MLDLLQWCGGMTTANAWGTARSSIHIVQHIGVDVLTELAWEEKHLIERNAMHDATPSALYYYTILLYRLIEYYLNLYYYITILLCIAQGPPSRAEAEHD